MKISKILLCLKVVFSSKFRFKKPEHKPIILFDGMSSNELKHILKNFNYFILETRFERTKEFFITQKIIFATIKNLKIGLFDSYLLSVIDEINPKIVFTFIDNSHRFSNFSKLRENNYHFIALQNGARYEHKITEKLKKKKIYVPIDRLNIPNFFCFGDYEIEDYKKNKQNIKNFYKVGSLKLANFELKKKTRKNIKEYDILLISDYDCWDLILNKLNYPIEKGLIKLIKYTIKFSMNNNLKIRIASRNPKNNFEKERNFYKKNLTVVEYKYLVKNIFFRPKNYQTYDMMLKSKLVIGTMSTMLRENLSLGGKTLACNFTKTDIFNFPIKGICFLDKDNYNFFEKQLNKLLKISNQKYFDKLNKNASYVSYTNLKNKTDTINLVTKKIKSILIK